MGKCKFHIRKVESISDKYDIAYGELYEEDADTCAEAQVCMPKYCNITNYVGKKVYYEIVDGKVEVTRVTKKAEKSASVKSDDAEQVG